MRKALVLTACLPLLAAAAHAQYFGWYWKAGYHDYAPEGMPDFDQTQDPAWVYPWSGQYTYCGPVAALNSLWWFDSRYETSMNGPWVCEDNFPLLVDMMGLVDDHDPVQVNTNVWNLAWLMDTDGLSSGMLHKGTTVDGMVDGLRQYLDMQGLSPYTTDRCWFQVVAQPDPSWGFICEELKLCHDVVLLLGFWQQNPDTMEWTRLGGHYVTVAGVNEDNMEIAICDPILDMMCWGHLPGHPPQVHNDTAYVAHDIYWVDHFRFREYGTPELQIPDYPVYWDTPYGWLIENFLGCNPSHFYQDEYPYWDPAWPIVTKIEVAIKVWPNGTYGGSVLEWAGWHIWAPFYKTPWIWPDDYVVYDPNTEVILPVSVAAVAPFNWLQLYIFGNGPTGYITYPGAVDAYIYPGYGYWVLTNKPGLRIMAPYHLACGHTCWWRQGPIIPIDHSLPTEP